MSTQPQRMALALTRCWVKLSNGFLFLMGIYTRKKNKVWSHTQTNTFRNNGPFYQFDSPQLKYLSSAE